MQTELGISIEGRHFENHGAYLASWLKTVKDNPKEFYAAASDAERISDYVADNYLKERAEESSKSEIEKRVEELEQRIHDLTVDRQNQQIHAMSMLIAPKFGTRPENHVAVSMTFEVLSELMLVTKAHYQAWLVAKYVTAKGESGQCKEPEEAENGCLYPFPQ